MTDERLSLVLSAPEQVHRDAVLSEDRLYRYSLSREWNDSRTRMVWIMLNPSTADALVDDPTIRRCMSFARRYGYGSIEVINLYALRATKPIHLLDHPDPEGPENDETWEQVLTAADGPIGPVVAAWGASRPKKVAYSKALNSRGVQMLEWKCLGLTSHHAPRHPLYVKADQPLVDL